MNFTWLCCYRKFNDNVDFFYQGEGGKLRRAPSWRKKFRTKDRSRESGDEGESGGTEGQTQQSPQHARRQGGADNSMHRRTTEHMMNY